MHPTKEQHLETMASSTPLSGQEGYRSGGERLAQNIDS